MFSVRSYIVGCNHGPVCFGRSGRAGLFEPVSRHRRGMGAGAWDALGHSQSHRGAYRGHEAATARCGKKGGAKCARNPQASAADASADGQRHLRSRMVDQARIAIAVLNTTDAI